MLSGRDLALTAAVDTGATTTTGEAGAMPAVAEICVGAAAISFGSLASVAGASVDEA